jgi:phosphatidylglycerophosphate synthase
MLLSIQINSNAGKSGNTEPAIIKPTSIFPISRQLGYYLSLVLIRTPLSANQVTFISMLIGLTGCSFFIKGELVWNIYGSLLLVLSYSLDYCDGVIARFKNQCSPVGAAFDDFVDWLVDTAIFLGLGYGTWVSSGEVIWLWLGFIAAGGSSMDYIIDLIRVNRFTLARKAAKKKALAEPDANPELGGNKSPQTIREKLFYIFHTLSRAEFCFIILSLSIFDVVWILLPFGAIGAQAFWLGDLFRKHK